MKKILIPVLIVIILALLAIVVFLKNSSLPNKQTFPNKSVPTSIKINKKDSSDSNQPISFAVMVHLEGDLNIENEKSYENINSDIKEILDLFSKYDAVATVESELSYANAASKYGNDMLNYALKNGHGVGTHCDTDREERDYNSLLNEYKRRKSKIDSVVGEENNLGCSGGWSYADWARAAYDAGFSYLDAPVVMAYLAIPPKNRPINPETGKPFSDIEIKNLYYHDPIPEDINERITPRFLENTKDFEADDSGILLLTGSLGEIASLAEGRKNCFPNCSLTKDDTDYIIENIDNLKNQGGVLYLHFPVYTLKRNDPKIVEEWLRTMQEYQNQGIIKWESMKDIFKKYKFN